ncbi:hypothetical protein [Caballeronia sp. GAFFF1]|uniref:hypothetical protein n=1 Tax=Caballeronia sp. GAFFF1 TaxID=2921779 RepID=UPI0020277DFA|nr:hypothetical protein [Caballeronia sp. GAFFF1]
MKRDVCDKFPNRATVTRDARRMATGAGAFPQQTRTVTENRLAPMFTPTAQRPRRAFSLIAGGVPRGSGMAAKEFR